MIVYIAGCQPEVIKEFGFRAKRSPTEPDNIGFYGWNFSLNALSRYNHRIGISLTREHIQNLIGGMIEISTLDVETQMSRDYDSIGRLVIPKKFLLLPEPIWNRVADSYQQRPDLAA